MTLPKYPVEVPASTNAQSCIAKSVLIYCLFNKYKLLKNRSFLSSFCVMEYIHCYGCTKLINLFNNKLKIEHIKWELFILLETVQGPGLQTIVPLSFI